MLLKKKSYHYFVSGMCCNKPFMTQVLLQNKISSYDDIYVLENADPYPFILLNLLLSCIAALQAPIIMMSQNRESKKDRLRSSNDYKTDLKSELILEELHREISRLTANQNKILKLLEEREENKKD